MRNLYLLLLLPLLAACGGGSVLDRLVPKRYEQRTAPGKIGIYFTAKSITKPYMVVGKYHVNTSQKDFEHAIIKVTDQASLDGCDAVLLERAWKAKTTIVGWMFLFIPFPFHAGQLDMMGIRFLDRGGQ